MSAERAPTAVLVTDSMHAVALYRRLGERGLRPGRDLSVLALLPEARAQYLIPTLTTVQTDWTAIGEKLADAAQAELAFAAGDTSADGAAPTRVQSLAPVALKPGESVSRAEDLEHAAARGR